METNKELIAQLREYASNPGYSHNDYADTMRDAAAALANQADAAPGEVVSYQVKDGIDWIDVAKEQYDRCNPLYRRALVAVSQQADAAPVVLANIGTDGPAHWSAALAQRAGSAAVPVAYVPIHPRNGPLWASTIPSLDRDHPSYEMRAVYFTPPAAPLGLTDAELKTLAEMHFYSEHAATIDIRLHRYARAILAAATQPAPDADKRDADRIAKAAAEVINGYADNYDTMQRISGEGTVDYRSVAHDLRTNIKDGVSAAILAAASAKESA